jgi:hypothetical protein
MPRQGVGLTFGVMALLTATDEKVKAHVFLFVLSEHSQQIKKLFNQKKLMSQQDKMGNMVK